MKTSHLPSVAEIMAKAKERNIPMTEKKAKALPKRWRVEAERRAMPGGHIQGNMEIFERYIQPGFIVANPETKTAYSIPRTAKKR